MTFRFSIGITLLLISTISVRAAEITTSDFWGMPGIFIIGEIALGDDQVFAQQAKAMPRAVVVLREPGRLCYSGAQHRTDGPSKGLLDICGP